MHTYAHNYTVKMNFLTVLTILYILPCYLASKQLICYEAGIEFHINFPLACSSPRNKVLTICVPSSLVDLKIYQATQAILLIQIGR